MTLVLDRTTADAANADHNYYQCLLRQGEMRTVGWIEARGAQQGYRVEIKGEGFWIVEDVYYPGQSIEWIREKQRKDRNSCPSILHEKK